MQALAGAAGGGAQRLPRARARDVRRGGRDAPALAGRRGPSTPGAGYPTTGRWANRLKLAAHLLAANLGTRIITIHWGGFDTHSGQLASQDAQLMELSRALGGVPRRPPGARHRGPRVHAGLLRVRPARRRERLGGDRPRRRRPDAGDGQQGARRSRLRVARLPAAGPRARQQRGAGQPEGADRLPLRLPRGDRGVAGRRPRRDHQRRPDRRPGARRRRRPAASCSNDRRPARRGRGDGHAARRRRGGAAAARQGRRLRRAPSQDQARVPAPRRPPLPQARALAPRPAAGAVAASRRPSRLPRPRRLRRRPRARCRRAPASTSPSGG